MAGRWGTKSVEQSIDDTDEPDTRLRKDLTWWDLTVFGVSTVPVAGSAYTFSYATSER
jgi:APA family basic amino acid/polyamine antiporter